MDSNVNAFSWCIDNIKCTLEGKTAKYWTVKHEGYIHALVLMYFLTRADTQHLACQMYIAVGSRMIFFLLCTSQCGLIHHIVLHRRVWPALLLLLFPSTVAAEESSLLEGWQDVWFFRFLVNMLGYSTIIIPGYLLISYFKRINYLETGLGLWDTDI